MSRTFLVLTVVAFAPVAFAPLARADEAAFAPSRADVAARLAAAGSNVPVRDADYRLADAILVADGPPPPPVVPTPAPPVTVYGTATPVATYRAPSTSRGGWSPTGLAQDTRIGPNAQPEWTTDRRFSRVRTYVIAPGQVEFESWYYGKYRRHGEGDTHTWQEEISVGLPHRFMADMYVNIVDDRGGETHALGGQFELRYAFADWGCLPLNPTAYAEYKVQEAGEPDVAEVKLLLSADIACRWVGGVNFAYERELSGEEEEVLGVSAAASYTLIDQRLNVGAEVQLERVTVDGSRDDPEYELIAGPSIQIQFNHLTHLDIAPLFGITDAAPKMKLYVIFGIDLSPGGEGGWYDPVSSRGR